MSNTESTEFEVFGISVPIKNAAIGIAFTIVTGAAGTIWGAAEFMGRLESQEEAVAEASATAETLAARFQDMKDGTASTLASYDTKISNVEQALRDNDVNSLQGKLAELGTNLRTIMERQQELLAIKERVVEVEKLVKEMQVTVQKAEIATADADKVSDQLSRIQKEVEDLWSAMDYLSNPIGN